MTERREQAGVRLGERVTVALALQQKRKPIGPNDLIVAATVMGDRGTLVTHNLREFRRIKELSVEDWTK